MRLQETQAMTGQPTTRYVVSQGSPDVHTVAWVLAGSLVFVLGITVPVIGFFVTRELKRRDGNERRTDGLASAITEVRDLVHETKLMVVEMRSWSNEKFPSRVEFDKAVARLEEEDKSIRADLKAEFDNCKELHPLRRQGGDI